MMFVYLSKKIAIPNGIRLNSAVWNPVQKEGWISCCGDDGLLKVLRLEAQATKDSRSAGIAAPTTLTMNQTLEGHNGAVLCAAWNPQFQKLTTSDEYGLIIVWVIHKGRWFEEMINNRNKSVVRDMKWKANGEEICIVYEDGAVIVGSVDGNRLWGKELNVNLHRVEWAPDGRVLLFVLSTGHIHLYNAGGTKLGEIRRFAVEDISEPVSVASIEWYDGLEGHEDPNWPTLAIAFENGRVQLMRTETDDKPVLIDTGMQLVDGKWNTSGTVFALAGFQPSSTGGKGICQVQFYSPNGTYLRTLKVPGQEIRGISWEGGGLRLSLAVDSFVYFANVRPDYKWGYFGDTLVYAFNKLDRSEPCVVFWDTRTNERYQKYPKRLLGIRAAGDHCVLATAADDGSGQYVLILCNAIGSPVDNKYIDLEPKFLTITSTHVVAANETTLYVWQFRTGVSRLTSADASTISSLRRKEGREKFFHIDDISATSTATGSATGGNGSKTGVTNSRPTGSTADEVTCITASDNFLVVGRASGTVHRYTLPHVALDSKFVLRCRPAEMALNCDDTKLSIIDISAKLSIFDFTARAPKTDNQQLGNSSAQNANGPGEHLSEERKDCWAMKWAEDNPDLLATMEKTRMYIFRGSLADPEEPVQSSGYLCRFNDLTVRVALMDDILMEPANPDKNWLIDYETRSLRDTRQLLATAGLQSTFQFVNDNSHPRLWRSVAENALQQLDLNSAERAFAAYQDYQGIQFVKRLRRLGNKTKQRAEIAVYFQRFDDAEKLYSEMDRRDLSIELRARLGDWFRVIQLAQTGGAGANDELIVRARNNLGDYFADRQKWGKALQYYSQTKNVEAMADCYYMLDDFAGLGNLIENLPQGTPLLHDIGTKLQRVGVVDKAVDALLKAGDVKAAVDACVLLNEWERAVKLAEEHDFPQIEGLLTKYATHLLESKKIFPAIELYRKAGRSTESAKLLARLASETGAMRVKPLRAKKLYVLAALEVERFRSTALNLKTMTAATITGATDAKTAATRGGRYGTTAATAATLDTLLKQDAEATVAGLKGEDAAAARTLDRAWHGAEAWHFFMLAQRQLYDGDIEAAMITSLRLVDYEDVLDARDIYSLIVLTTYYNGYFGQCGKAFIKLETLDPEDSRSLATVSVKEQNNIKDSYADLAMRIFVHNSPTDPGSRAYQCTRCRHSLKGWDTACMNCGRKYPGCVVSGRPLFEGKALTCKRCKHGIASSEVRAIQYCPLCHEELPAA